MVSEPTWVEVSAAACLVDSVLRAVVVAELSCVVDSERCVERVKRGRRHGAELGRGQRLHLRGVERASCEVEKFDSAAPPAPESAVVVKPARAVDVSA